MIPASVARSIHILGASGSGTTTLACALAERRGYAQLDTDDFFWHPTDPPYQRSREVGERLDLLRAALAPHTAWVLSGSLCGWGDPLIPLFDLVVYLRLPTDIRIQRLRAREAGRFGEAIAPGGPLHHEHEKFIAWAANYDGGDSSTRSRIRHEGWLAALPCRVLRIEGEHTTERRIAMVMEAMDEVR